MPVFEYKAISSKGMIVRNRMEETVKQNVYSKLKRNSYIPIKIRRVRTLAKSSRKKQKKNIEDRKALLDNIDINGLQTKRKFKDVLNTPVLQSSKIPKRDIMIFTQNLYLLKKANFNNIHALNTIIQSTENYRFRDILEDILAGVEAGDNMYTTMEYYEDVFPYIYINMIKVGELSGSLLKSLEQAIKYLDDTDTLTRKLKKILVPNLIQFIGLIVLLIVGTLVAIPSIQNLFETVGTNEQLPAITLWFSRFIDKLIANWYKPTIVISVIVLGIIYYINTPKGKYNFHYFKYVMPVFGKLIYLLDLSRVMKAMLLNLENGMRIQEALEVSKSVAKNQVMLAIIENARNNIIIGQSWIEPFEKMGLSSAMTTEMLKIGMQTDLTEMMDKILQYIEIDIDNALERIMKVLPEIVYCIVGIVLIFFVLVVLVPCIQVYMGNFLFSAAGV